MTNVLIVSDTFGKYRLEAKEWKQGNESVTEITLRYDTTILYSACTPTCKIDREALERVVDEMLHPQVGNLVEHVFKMLEQERRAGNRLPPSP